MHIIQKLVDNKISIQQATEALNKSERTIFRYKSILINKGFPGFVHGLKNKPSNNKNDSMEKLKHYATKKKYRDFGPTILAEALEEELQGGTINPESLRIKMIQRGLWIPKNKKKKTKRTLRQKSNKKGNMVQFDGSYHLRLENGIIYCLLLAIDDATGEIIKMYLTSGESLAEIEAFWKEYFEEFGKPEIIYLDCHATYKVNHEQDQFDKEMLIRFQIAMQKFGVQIIYSKTPEGKGRVERCFQTLQDRLIKKLRINNINTVEEANKYIKYTYISEHNRKFGKLPKEEGDTHIEFTEEEKHNFHWYFAKEINRKFKRNGTIQYNNVIYQLERGQNLYNGTTITIKENNLGEIDIFSGKTSLNYHKLIEKVP